MKTSTTTNIYYRRPGNRKCRYVESIEKIAQAGFDCVDMNFTNAIVNPANELNCDNWRQNVEEIAEALEKWGLTANQAHAPFYQFLDPDLKDGEWKYEMTRRSVMAAGLLGVRWIIVHPGTIFGNPRKKDNIDANAEYLKPLLEIADEYGTGIALENIFDKFITQPGGKITLDTPLTRTFNSGRIRTSRHFANWPEELAELVDYMQAYGKVGACWDTGHGFEMMVDQEASIEILGSRLKALHVNDNFGVFDNHLVPYFGQIDWEPILRALNKIGYDGELTLETGANYTRVPEVLIDDALRYAAKVARYMADQFENM